MLLGSVQKSEGVRKNDHTRKKKVIDEDRSLLESPTRVDDLVLLIRNPAIPADVGGLVLWRLEHLVRTIVGNLIPETAPEAQEAREETP